MTSQDEIENSLRKLNMRARAVRMALLGEMGPFMAGDRVLVRKPSARCTDIPSWTTRMDKYDNTIQTIHSAYAGYATGWHLVGCGLEEGHLWVFGPDDLTLVED